jgi:hypothetical protein
MATSFLNAFKTVLEGYVNPEAIQSTWSGVDGTFRALLRSDTSPDIFKDSSWKQSAQQELCAIVEQLANDGKLAYDGKLAHEEKLAYEENLTYDEALAIGEKGMLLILFIIATGSEDHLFYLFQSSGGC